MPGPVAFQANPVHTREILPLPVYAYVSVSMTIGVGEYSIAKASGISIYGPYILIGGCVASVNGEKA